MKRVDQGIKYLSGELEATAARAWEEDLKGDPDLRKEFEDMAFCYELMKAQLQKQDLARFRARLQAAMEASDRKQEPSARSGQRPFRRLLFPVAAAAAVLLGLWLILAPPGDPFERYYAPAQDPVLVALSSATRAGDASLLALYQDQEMDILYQKSLARLGAPSPSPELKLLHLIAALETGREAAALELLPLCTPTNQDPLERAFCWYRALALLKTGHAEASMKALESLRSLPGPYAGDADKLLEVLRK